MGLPQSHITEDELVRIAAIQQRVCQLYEVDDAVDVAQLRASIRRLEAEGFLVIYTEGSGRKTLGIVGDPRPGFEDAIGNIHSHLTPLQVIKPFKLASHEFHLTRTVVEIGDDSIGGTKIPLLTACNELSALSDAVTGEDGQDDSTLFIDLNLELYKPAVRESAFELLKTVRAHRERRTIIRVDSSSMLRSAHDVADAVYISGEQMQNYNLLQEAGQSSLPVFLERGVRSTIDEWLAAAEYILAHGNANLILSTGGIRTFAGDDDELTVDIASIPVLKSLTHLPVAMDIRGAGGNPQHQNAIASASVAAGVDAIFYPAGFMSPGTDQFHAQLKRIASALNRIV